MPLHKVFYYSDTVVTYYSDTAVVTYYSGGFFSCADLVVTVTLDTSMNIAIISIMY